MPFSYASKFICQGNIQIHISGCNASYAQFKFSPLPQIVAIDQSKHTCKHTTHAEKMNHTFIIRPIKTNIFYSLFHSKKTKPFMFTNNKTIRVFVCFKHSIARL